MWKPTGPWGWKKDSSGETDPREKPSEGQHFVGALLDHLPEEPNGERKCPRRYLFKCFNFLSFTREIGKISKHSKKATHTKKKRDKLIKEKTKKGENTGKTKQGADKHTHYIIDIMENQILF